MMTPDQIALGALVRTYYDMQSMQQRLLGRCGLKADQKTKKKQLHEHLIPSDYAAAMTGSLKIVTEDMARYEKMIAKALREFPIWTEWLDGVKGVGPILGGVIVSTYDIEKATTASKLFQYTGCNPSTVRGWKSDGLDKHGVPKWKISDDMIRGDKPKAGYRCPFNSKLRTKMVGVLGPSFLKAQSPVYAKAYYDLHVPVARRAEMGVGRLDMSEQVYEPTGKMWKDESEGHRANAATRKMIKLFLADLYQAWRTLEGLPVRAPYAEEYLGRAHEAAVAV